MHDHNFENMESEASIRFVGTCICCLNEAPVKSMMEENSAEPATIIFKHCFGIDVLATDIGDTKRSICADCEQRLRDALGFRKLVERSLALLNEQAKLAYSDVELKVEVDTKHKGEYAQDEGNIEDTWNADDVLSSALSNIKHEGSSDEDIALATYKTKPKKARQSITSKILIDPSQIPTEQEMLEFINNGLFPMRSNNQWYKSCLLCRKTFRDLHKMAEHWTTHKSKKACSKFNAIKKMAVTDCSVQFAVVGSKLRCKLCNVLISDGAKMSEHVKCDARPPFKIDKDRKDCPICKEKFLSFVSLNKHMNVHYPNYVCDSCGKAFASKPRFRAHQRIHQFGEFPCKYCNKVFDVVTKREHHMTVEHRAGGVRYKCRVCGAMLPSFYAKQRHLAEAHDETLKRYKCALCPQSYIAPGHLSSHVRRDHLRERKHECNKCDMAFYTRHSLTMHMVSHDGERVHVCQVCGKSYLRAKTLKEHMRIHNNDKRFACIHCGRCFTQKCTLKQHLKVHDRRGEEDTRLIAPKPAVES